MSSTLSLNKLHRITLTENSHLNKILISRALLRQEKTGYFLLLSNGRLAFGKARSFPRALCSFSGFIADPFGVWHATQYEMAGNTFLPGDDSCEALIADSSPESSLSLSACDLCGVFRFLVSNFDVLIEEKKKQTPLTFDNFRSHSSRFSQIQFHAFSISWSFTRHTHLNPTTEHCFSTFAMILHSALSRISLLLSWEHGLLILKLSNALKYSAHVSLYLMRPQDDRRPITVRKQAEGNRNSSWIGLSLFLLKRVRPFIWELNHQLQFSTMNSLNIVVF